MCQIWCVIYKLDLHTSTHFYAALACLHNAKMPTYLIRSTYFWMRGFINAWMSLLWYVCVHLFSYVCERDIIHFWHLYVCVRDKKNSKCQREWQCTHVVMCLFLTEPICTKALSLFCCKDEFLAACCVMAFQHHQKIITDQRGTGR